MQGTYLDTIIPRDDLPENKEVMPEIGQRAHLSKGDILQTMALYGCPGIFTKKFKISSFSRNIFVFSVCGRTFQETKAIIGSPQQSAYSFTPGIKSLPYKMVRISFTFK